MGIILKRNAFEILTVLQLLCAVSIIRGNPSLYYTLGSDYGNHLAPGHPSALLQNLKSQFHAQDELGQYSYGYNDGVSSKVESKTADGVTKGSYAYVDPEGTVRNVNYISDSINGFRVSETNLPAAMTVKPVFQNTPVIRPSHNLQFISQHEPAPPVSYMQQNYLQPESSVLAEPQQFQNAQYLSSDVDQSQYRNYPEVEQSQYNNQAASQMAKYDQLLQINKHQSDGKRAHYTQNENDLQTATAQYNRQQQQMHVHHKTAEMKEKSLTGQPLRNEEEQKYVQKSLLLNKMQKRKDNALNKEQKPNAYTNFLKSNNNFAQPNVNENQDIKTESMPLFPGSLAPAPVQKVHVEVPHYYQQVPTVQLYHEPSINFQTAPATTSYMYTHVPAAAYSNIYSQYHSQDELGQYSYGYSGGPSSKVESRTADGITRGGYSYIDANGIVQKVSYISDPINGFRVMGTNLPYSDGVSPFNPSPYYPLTSETDLNQISENHRIYDD